ncbi:hypothetical protein I4000191A8_27070 [Clostridia bacterium i40-0019-1A8]
MFKWDDWFQSVPVREGLLGIFHQGQSLTVCWLTAAKTHGTLYVETNKSPAGAGNIDRALQNERGL